jgi:hypothetical protein
LNGQNQIHNAVDGKADDRSQRFAAIHDNVHVAFFVKHGVECVQVRCDNEAEEGREGLVLAWK